MRASRRCSGTRRATAITASATIPIGHVDVEDPAPRGVVDQEAADQRPGDAADPEDRAEDALIAAAVARRDDVADDRLREDDEPAAAEALQRAEGDELAHALRLAAQRRPDEEDDDRGLEDALAPVEVAELAVERRRDRRGQQVAGDDPGELVEAAELGGDGRQRGGDDRPVERGQQDRQHERREDDQDLAARTRRRGRQRSRRSGHAGSLELAALPDRVALLREGDRALARVLGGEDRTRQLALALPELLLAPVELLLEDRLRRVERERAVGARWRRRAPAPRRPPRRARPGG